MTTTSNIPPTSSLQTESTVLPVPVNRVWTHIRSLSLDALAPSLVTKTSLVNTDESSSSSSSVINVGSVLAIEYADGTIWNVRITEISDRHYTLAYEVIETKPMPSDYTAVEGEIILKRITQNDETFLEWTTIFSNDADATVLMDQKYKKLDFFTQFVKTLTNATK